MVQRTSFSVMELSPILMPYFLAFFIFRGFFSNFPLYLQLTRGLSDTATVEIWGIMSGVALLVGAITRLPAGLLSDWMGRFKALLLAYAVYLLSMLIIFFFDHLYLYFLAMSVLRFGVNTFAMTGRSVVSSSREQDRGLKNGLLSSMVGLGGFVGPTILAVVLDRFPPRFMIIASVLVIILDLFLFFILYIVMPKLIRRIDPTYKVDLNMAAVLDRKGSTPTSGIRRSGIIESFFLFFAAGMIYGLVTSIYTIYGYNILGISLSFLGLITGIGSLIQMVWAPIVGKLYEYIRDEFIRLFAWSVLAISSIIMVFSSLGSMYFILGYFILNFGNASYFTMEITRMGSVVKEEEFSFVFGIATSLIILATAIAGFLAPSLYNWFAEGTFFVSILFGFAAFAIVLRSTIKMTMQKNTS